MILMDGNLFVYSYVLWIIGSGFHMDIHIYIMYINIWTFMHALIIHSRRNIHLNGEGGVRFLSMLTLETRR